MKLAKRVVSVISRTNVAISIKKKKKKKKPTTNVAILIWENYIILYIKCVLPHLTEVMGPTINLISGIHHFCERREYTFNVLSEYIIIP